MCILGAAPITAVELATKISSESDLTWDWGERPIKNLLYDLGREKSDLVFCRKKGLPGEETLDIQEWLLDLVWMDREKLAIHLAVESEFASSMLGRLDDFQKLMVTKAPLKLFIYATRTVTDGAEVREKIQEYLNKFSQHVKGEHYLLADVRQQQVSFYEYVATNDVSVAEVKLLPLLLRRSSPA